LTGRVVDDYLLTVTLAIANTRAYFDWQIHGAYAV